MSWQDVFDSCKYSEYEKCCICTKKNIEIVPLKDCANCEFFIDEVAEERNI